MFACKIKDLCKDKTAPRVVNVFRATDPRNRRPVPGGRVKDVKRLLCRIQEAKATAKCSPSAVYIGQDEHSALISVVNRKGWLDIADGELLAFMRPRSSLFGLPVYRVAKPSHFAVT